MESVLVLVTLVMLIACYIIYRGWKQQKRNLAIAGWLGIAMGMVISSTTMGVEYGLTIGLFLPAITVWLGIALCAQWREFTPGIIKTPHRWQWNGKRVLLNAFHCLHICIIQLCICSLTVVAVVYQLPVSEPKQMAIGIIVLPVIWGVMAYGYLVSLRKPRHVGLTLLCAFLSAYYLLGVSHG